MKFDEMTKEELVDYINNLNEELNGKYGLVWDKEKELEQIVVDCDKYIPILKEINDKGITNGGENNILIEGDNFHSLSVLNYTHKESIDIIYIDPPYNTGNNDFMYNDKYIDQEDGYRHSKWLNFMEKRLKLSKYLLKENGLIFISIDDNELYQLKLLCDKIFGAHNFINNIVVKMSEASGIKMAHVESRLPKLKEYLLVYKKNTVTLNNIRVNKEEWDNEYKTVITNVSKEELEFIKSVVDNEKRTEKEVIEVRNILDKADYITLSEAYKNDSIINNEDKINYNYENAYRIFQTVSMGSGTTDSIRESKKKHLKNKFFVHITPKNKMYIIKGDFEDNARKPRLQVLFADQYLTYNPCDLWTDIKTTGLDNEGFVDFKNGKKPLKLIKRILELSNNKNATVLDFFAGSGTTGQAVLEQNAEDDGDRKFILCTNNENNICEDITYLRLKRTIEGYKNYESKNGSLKYFKTDFVNYAGTRDQLYYDLTEKCISMLCVKSDTYDLVEKNKEFVIYSNGDNTEYSCVYFDIFGESYDKFINRVKSIKEHKYLYIFSLSEYVNNEDFKGIINYSIEPIPYKILDLYKNVVKMSKEN